MSNSRNEQLMCLMKTPSVLGKGENKLEGGEEMDRVRPVAFCEILTCKTTKDGSKIKM